MGVSGALPRAGFGVLPAVAGEQAASRAATGSTSCFTAILRSASPGGPKPAVVFPSSIASRERGVKRFADAPTPRPASPVGASVYSPCGRVKRTLGRGRNGRGLDGLQDLEREAVRPDVDDDAV